MTMVTTDHLGHFLVCTHNPPIHMIHNIYQQKLMNRNLQTKVKMVHDNNLNESSKSKTKPTVAMCMMGTCSSAHLAKKLKQLMENSYSLGRCSNGMRAQ